MPAGNSGSAALDTGVFASEPDTAWARAIAAHSKSHSAMGWRVRIPAGVRIYASPALGATILRLPAGRRQRGFATSPRRGILTGFPGRRPTTGKFSCGSRTTRCRRIYGNTKNNHTLRISEPRVTPVPGIRDALILDFYVEHKKRLGSNPVAFFTAVLQDGRVLAIKSRSVRDAARLQGVSIGLLARGVNLAADSALSWLTGGLLALDGGFLDLVDQIQGANLHPYRGWERAALWYASQVTHLYVRQLYVRQ